MARLALIAVAIFKCWMFVDAIRRKVDTHWYYVILFVPLGGVAYFFQVKLRDPGVHFMKRRLLETLKRPPSVEQLERAFKRTPSIDNQIRLGQGLFDAERYSDAHTHFEAVLDKQPADKAALHGLGCCLVELQRPADALEPLRSLIDAHPGYRDYEPWPELAEALWQTDQREESLELLTELTRRSPRLRHLVLQARYLKRAGRKADATKILNTALEDDRDSPRHVQKQNRPYARQAKDMLAEMATRPRATSAPSG